jgi:hypothetical protein
VPFVSTTRRNERANVRKRTSQPGNSNSNATFKPVVTCRAIFEVCFQATAISGQDTFCGSVGAKSPLLPIDVVNRDRVRKRRKASDTINNSERGHSDNLISRYCHDTGQISVVRKGNKWHPQRPPPAISKASPRRGHTSMKVGHFDGAEESRRLSERMRWTK